jgi:Flp pilus assembly protein TadB
MLAPTRVYYAMAADGVFFNSVARPGYPILPALFVAVAVWIVASVLWTNPVRSGVGVLILATGVPAFAYWRRRSRGNGKQ